MLRSACILLVALLAGCGKSSAPVDDRPRDGDFTVVLIPDTQYYMGQHRPLFEAQIRWIAEQKEAQNIVAAIHLGDMTNGNTPGEWKLVDRVFKMLDDADVPWSPMPGNHDGVRFGLIKSGNYNQWFGVSRFSSKPWWGGHYGDTNDNHYIFFEAGGMEFMVLSLAFGNPQEQLDWANQVLDQYPQKRVIFATHAYLDDDATYLLRNEEFGVEDPPMRWNDGQQVWDKVIKGHPNVFMTVCGHVPDQARRVSTNDAGRPVHELLVNYQGIANGGNGYLRLLRFSPSRDKIFVEAYSPPLDKVWRDDRHTFVLDYEMP